MQYFVKLPNKWLCFKGYYAKEKALDKCIYYRSRGINAQVYQKGWLLIY
jgi:hypothetical protein